MLQEQKSGKPGMEEFADERTKVNPDGRAARPSRFVCYTAGWSIDFKLLPHQMRTAERIRPRGFSLRMQPLKGAAQGAGRR